MLGIRCCDRFGGSGVHRGTFATPRPIPPHGVRRPRHYFRLDIIFAPFTALVVAGLGAHALWGTLTNRRLNPMPNPHPQVLWLRLSFAPLYGAPAKRTEL